MQDLGFNITRLQNNRLITHMIHKHFLKKENSQLQKSYLEGWNQSLQNFYQVNNEMGLLKKRLKKK